MRMSYLHVHSVYSHGDAIGRINDYTNFVHDYNRESKDHEIATYSLSEHGNMFSYINYSESCLKPNGADKRVLKPVYANEIYHVDNVDTVLDEEPILKKSNAKRNKKTNLYSFNSSMLHHLVVIAKNEVGLKNLFKITTNGGMNPFETSIKKYQVCDFKTIKKYGEGIIALTGCIGGKLSKLIQAGRFDDALKWVNELKDTFDEVYLEVQPHTELPAQLITNEYIKEIHKITGIPMVITTDAHYRYKEEKDNYDIVRQITFQITDESIAKQIASGKAESEIMKKESDTYNHLRTPEELIEFCKEYDFPLDIIENTAKITDSCNCSIEPKSKNELMPIFPVPKGYTEDSYLREKVLEGFFNKYKTNKDIKDIELYNERLQYELDIITQMQFSGYFLILWDWFKWCKENGILLGPGRGSAAGSIVSYFLDITKIDPIKYDLLFSRFLNPSRKDEPDMKIV